jgi:hypothetical protein
MKSDKIDFDKELAGAQRETDRLVAIATKHGFVLDMTEWLTIKHYAEKYNVSTQVVNNWVIQGVIPADCTMVVEELNAIRLVEDQPYK